jgi:hypothetical protein
MLREPFLHVSMLGIIVMTPEGNGNIFVQKWASWDLLDRIYLHLPKIS